MIRWVREHPTGPVVACLALVVLLFNLVLIPDVAEMDVVSTIDLGGSLLYLTLPLITMVAATITHFVERPWALDCLGPVRPRRWRARRVASAVLLPAVAPVVSTAVALAMTGGSEADLVSLVVYTVAPMLWLVLASSVGVAIARGLRHPASPLAAALVMAVIFILARNSLFALGASASLAGTTPETKPWALALLLMTTASGLLSIMLVAAGPSSRRVMVVTFGVAVLLVAVSPLVPSRTLQVAGSADRCSGGTIVVCSYPGYDNWREVTAERAEAIATAIEAAGASPPVTRVVQSTADLPASMEQGEVEVYVDRHEPDPGVPPLQLADLLLGPTCDSIDPFDARMDERRAVTAWLASTASGDESELMSEWPEFSKRSVQGKQEAVRSVIDQSDSCEGL